MPITLEQQHLINGIIRSCDSMEQSLAFYENRMRNLNDSDPLARQSLTLFLFHIIGVPEQIRIRLTINELNSIRSAPIEQIKDKILLGFRGTKLVYSPIKRQAEVCLAASDKDLANEIDCLQETIRIGKFILEGGLIEAQGVAKGLLHKFIYNLGRSDRRDIRKFADFEDVIYNLGLVEAMHNACLKFISRRQTILLAIVKLTPLDLVQQEQIKKQSINDATGIISDILSVRLKLRNAMKKRSITICEMVNNCAALLRSDACLKVFDQANYEVKTQLFNLRATIAKLIHEVNSHEETIGNWVKKPINKSGRSAFNDSCKAVDLIMELKEIQSRVSICDDAIKTLLNLKSASPQIILEPIKTAVYTPTSNSYSVSSKAAPAMTINIDLVAKEREMQKTKEVESAMVESRRLKEIEKEQKRAEYKEPASNFEGEEDLAEENENESFDTLFTSGAPLPINIGEVITGLSSKPLVLLTKIMTLPQNELHNKFTYSELKYLAKRLGADILNGKGSHRKFRFSTFDIDINKSLVSQAAMPLPKNKGRLDSGYMYGVYVEQFRDALIKLDVKKHLGLAEEQRTSSKPKPKVLH